MNTEITLGQKPSEEMIGIRDALHVPVICVKAHKMLSPGEHVGVQNNMTSPAHVVGVVDPFGVTWIPMGEPCLVILLPKSTGNVKHVWEHPSIDCEVPPARIPNTVCEPWAVYLKGVADKLGCNVSMITEAAEYYIREGTGSGGYQPGLDVDYDVINWVEFWNNYNQEHGTSINSEEDPFCC